MRPNHLTAKAFAAWLDSAARPNTSGYSDDDTRAGLILLNHH